MEDIFENDFDYDQLKEDFSTVRDEVDMRLKKSETKQGISDDKFFSVLNEIITAAENGDIVAQDYIAYLYKRGFRGLIPVSTKIFMEWSVLAAANGNKFTVEKLKIFLTPAINDICAEPDFEQIVKRNDLYLETYEYVISRLFCQAIVDYLHLDVKKMIKDLSTTILEDESLEMRVFDKAREAVYPKVVEFLRQ